MHKEKIDSDHEARGYNPGNPLPGPSYKGDVNDTTTGEKTDKTSSSESREDAANKSRESYESDKD